MDVNNKKDLYLNLANGLPRYYSCDFTAKEAIAGLLLCNCF